MKTISTIKLIFVLAFATLFYGTTCYKNTADCHMSFYIKNTSNKAIYFSAVPDSNLNKLNYNPGLSPHIYKCGVNGTKRFNHTSCYETEIDYFGKLYMFIFDSDIIETTSWEVIKQNHLLLKRYDLTKADMHNAGWVVTYP